MTTIDDIAARHAASTPGKWEIDRVRCEGEYGSGEDTHSGFDGFQVLAPNGDVIVDTGNSTAALIEEEWDEDGCVATDIVGFANATFIAHAHQDIPFLLAEVTKLTAALADAEARGRVAAWTDDPGLLTAPISALILAACPVNSIRGNEHWWDRHLIWLDDETGEVHFDCYQGWDRDSYTHWMLAPAEPTALAQSPEDGKQEPQT